MLVVNFTSNEQHNSIVTFLFTKHTTPLESIITLSCLWQAICDSAGINVEIIISIPSDCH